jgi:hypothetical protein
MPKTHSEYFSKYVSYFPTINKQLKLGRNGSIIVTDKTTKQVETYANWVDLNNVYKQFPDEVTIENPKEANDIEVKKESKAPKYFVFGHPTRYNELIEFFKNTYKLNNFFTSNNFNKKEWVYFIDSKGNLISTGNDIVIDLITNSEEWVEYKLPDPIKFTKAEIARLLGYSSPDEFEII